MSALTLLVRAGCTGLVLVGAWWLADVIGHEWRMWAYGRDRKRQRI